MPVFAEVSFRQLSASASYRKIHAVARQPASTVVISTQEPSPEVTFQRLVTDISYRYLTSQLQWKRLFLHDVVLNTEQTIYPLSDLFSLSDQPVLEPVLAKTDAFSMGDSPPILGIAPVFDDLFVFSDAQVFGVSSEKSDSFAFADSQAFAVSSAPSDFFAVQDAPISVVVNPGNIQYNPDADGDLSIAFPKSDSISAQDLPVFGVSKSLSDVFALDDNNDLDYAFSGAKSNVYSLTDLPVIGFSKAITDNILSTESAVFGIDPALSDSSALADSPAFSTGKVFSDSTSLSEQIVLVNYSSSSVLGDNLVGLMLLNAD